MLHLGSYNTATTRTHVRLKFSTFASAGGNVAPSSSIDAADIRIYRAADGAAFSATQRSSSSGITVTSPFDSLTGYHAIDIDLTDNTDAGFYAAGYLYTITLAPDDETIDSQVITAVDLAYFEIGPPPVNVTQVAGDTQSLTDLKDFADAGYDPSTNKVQGVVLVDTLTTYTGNTPQTGDAFARLGAPVGASVSADVAAVKADTGNLVTRITSTLFAGITSLAEWIGLLAGKQTGNTTARTELRATGAASGTYDETTDSLEANRDNIGTAGAGLTAADDVVITAIGALNNITAASVWSVGTRELTAGTNIVLAKGTGITGFNDPTAAANATAVRSELATELGRIDAAVSTRATPAQVNAEVDQALADYDAPTNAEMEARTLAAASYATAAALADVPTNSELTTAIAALFTTAMTESYNADGSPPTPAQALFVIMQTLTEMSIAGTTTTVKKLDGSTTAFTLTLNDGTTPTAVTRAT